MHIKRIIGLLCLVVFTALSVPSMAASPKYFGDVNGDGSVTVNDVALPLKIVVGLSATPLTGELFQAADMNGDGVIKISDVISILKTAVGLLVPRPFMGSGVSTTDTTAAAIGDGSVPVRIDARIVPTPGSGTGDQIIRISITNTTNTAVTNGKILLNIGNLKIKSPDKGGEIYYGWKNGKSDQPIGNGGWVKSISRNTAVIEITSDMQNSSIGNDESWLFGVNLEGAGGLKLDGNADATYHVYVSVNGDAGHLAKFNGEWRGSHPFCGATAFLSTPDWGEHSNLTVSNDGLVLIPASFRAMLAATGLSMDTGLTVGRLTLSVKSGSGWVTYDLSTGGQTPMASVSLPLSATLFPHAEVQGSVNLLRIPQQVVSMITTNGLPARLHLEFSTWATGMINGSTSNSSANEATVDPNQQGEDVLFTLRKL